ncbi:hypothetical protein SETIT_4G170200v2 [Setaria italica]|uniref:Uncharacterized protein n=1 Tax=Setaria italica TaxID=4555 RepID=A0A368QVN0_SETIT|nr:hypothetical protein SETIT_4G170200v2 [Setaria italica]
MLADAAASHSLPPSLANRRRLRVRHPVAAAPHPQPPQSLPIRFRRRRRSSAAAAPPLSSSASTPRRPSHRPRTASLLRVDPALPLSSSASTPRAPRVDPAPPLDFDRPSKFLVVCLNAIRDEVAPEDGGGSSIYGGGDWGVELWRSCSSPAPSDVLDTSGACATMEQTAWLISAACDIVARKERLGMVVSCPFLLYLVPSQEKAAQVRSICKPLKPLGIHSGSLHSGASVEHQISGITRTLQWQLVRLSTRSPNRQQRKYSDDIELSPSLIHQVWLRVQWNMEQ